MGHLEGCRVGQGLKWAGLTLCRGWRKLSAAFNSAAHTG